MLHGVYISLPQLLKKLCAMGQNVGGSTDSTTKLSPELSSPTTVDKNISSDSENEEEEEEQSPMSDTETKEEEENQGKEKSVKVKR